MILTPWNDDPLCVPRCACGHTVHFHTMDGGLYPCVHPACADGGCDGWREA